MMIRENKEFIKEIGERLLSGAPIRLGVNKKNELERLIYEICRRDDKTPAEVLEQAGTVLLAKEGKSDFFHRFKKRLLRLRYPSLGPDDDPHLVPLKIDKAREEYGAWDLEMAPRVIFVEKDVLGLDWTKKFLLNFPRAEIKEIRTFREGVKSSPASDPVEQYDQRRDKIFLIRNKDAFIKICPCTKGYRRCGYWILNAGFGCPMDCSYCFLQSYSNAPGLVLPANIEDYFPHLERFDKGLGKRTRIGTGEFTDSLALDRYTGYSSALIPFFRKRKNLVLELKTKVARLDNVLREEPHDNIVISWSVNTPEAASRYEKGGASMEERLGAAVEAAKRGYKVGFHFDPVIFSPGWEERYKAVVRDIFSRDELRKNTVWISLGTLRYTPGLKQVAEQRFSDNLMYYNGEFFVDTDGKLRYPRELRIDIYDKMIKWIRELDVACWIYLCMEPGDVWRSLPLIGADFF